MALLPEKELSERAASECALLMEKMIDADLSIESGKASSEWNPILARFVFSQSMDVWRDFNDIEVVVSEEGRILRFHDQNRFQNATYVPLQPREVLQIAGTTGLVGNYAAVNHISAGANGMLIADIRQKQAGFPDSVFFTINPSSRQVAAFEVKEELEL